MHAARLLLAERYLAVLVCAATLLLRLIVPTGYMIADDHGRVAITICSGTGPATSMMAMPGMHDDASGHGKAKDHGKAEMPCAFSSLSAAALGTIDPLQIAALIAFIMALGFVGLLLPAPFASRHLRPPLRGPPAFL